MKLQNVTILTLCVSVWCVLQHDIAHAQVEQKVPDIASIQKEISNLEKDLSVENVTEVDEEVSSLEKQLNKIQQQDGDISEKTANKIDQIEDQLGQLKKDIKAVEQEKWYLDPQAAFPPVGTVENNVVTDITRFNDIIAENELVVAYFFKLPPSEREIIVTDNGVRRRTDRWYTVDSNASAFGAVAEREMYLKADVPFIAVNLNDDQLGRLIDRYDITDRDTIMLFKAGVPYTKNVFTGPFDQFSIRRYVDRYFEDVIQEQIKEQREKEQRKQEKREVVKEVRYDRRPSVGFGIGYGGYDPYYNYGWPYGRRYYGHPYRRYGSGFHFGFGI